MAKKKDKAKVKNEATATATAEEKAAGKGQKRAAKAEAKALEKAKKREKRERKAARKAVKRAIPKGYHSVQAYLCVEGAQRAIDFYTAAFGAEVKEALFGPDGKLMHGELRIGDSVVMIGDARPEVGMTPTKVQFYLYVADCDAIHARAVAAGATPKADPADMFWGDRFGSVEDPFGNTWSIATQVERVSPKELKRRAEAFMAAMAAGECPGCGEATTDASAPPAAPVEAPPPAPSVPRVSAG